MYTPSSRSAVARIIFLCSIAVLIFTEESSAGVPGEHRIVNGVSIAIEDAPYTVHITDTYGGWICGGSLVSKQFVVTAAHCFHSRFARELRVVAGATKRENYGDEAIKVKVAKLFIHPEYVFNPNPNEPSVNEHMDAAVLKLAEPIAFNERIKSIDMCTEALKPKDKIQIVGWGHTSYRGVQSDTLQSIDVPVFSDDQCMELHKDSVTKITHSMVCAGLPNKDACQGDSGGPAVRKDKLCGIVSWGVGCADNKHPGVYTSIPVVRDFIDKCMRE